MLTASKMDAARLRGLQHDLSGRGDLAVASGLNLRRRTHAHLAELSARREYLIARYGPETLGSWTQINRLMATLDEVAAKVEAAARTVREIPQARSAA